MIESRKPEKCYYCDKKAEYNQLVEDSASFVVSGVCKDHLSMGLIS